MTETTVFVEELFRKFAECGICYCILRNAEEVEQGDAHDVDMTVDINRMKETEAIMLRHAEEKDWKLHIKTGSARDTLNIKCYHFYRAVQNEIQILHFDFFPTFMWKGYVLLDNAQLLEDMEQSTLYHRASPAVEAVTKLFIRLLYNGCVKEKYKDRIQEVFRDNVDAVQKLLGAFLDRQSIEFVIDSVFSGNWMALERQRTILVEAIKANTKHRVFANKLYLLQKAFKKTGVMVAFEGTDGSGKSTIIDGLRETLANSFPEGMFDYYHWRPGVVKKKKVGDTTVSEPHAKAPYGKLKSFVKFMFFNLDYIIGYWVKIRWQVAKGHLVVFDRYYYDYYLDKIRYRLTISDTVLNAFRWMIPKPEVTFLLIGDSEVLYERKKEIPVEEIQRQIDILKLNKNQFSNSVIIDVNQTIEKTIFDTGREILRVCERRYI